MTNSEELAGTTEYLTLYAGCRTQRCRYNRARLYLLEITPSYDGVTYYSRDNPR